LHVLRTHHRHSFLERHDDEVQGFPLCLKTFEVNIGSIDI
jgi:hypothetical protein